MRWQNKLSWIMAAAFALAVMAAPLAAAPVAPGVSHAQQDQTTTTAKTKKSKKKKSKTTADSSTDQTAAAAPAAATTKPKRSRSKKSATAAASDSAATSASEPSASSAATKMASRGHAGAGQVWVNTGTGTFHYEGSKFYGKTKQGKYMSESDAVKAGYHAAKNEKKPGSGLE